MGVSKKFPVYPREHYQLVHTQVCGINVYDGISLGKDCI